MSTKECPEELALSFEDLIKHTHYQDGHQERGEEAELALPDYI